MFVNWSKTRFPPRTAFNCFRAGNHYQGVSKSDLFRSIAGFLRKIHMRGGLHRDLSAGNLLCRADGLRGFEIFVVDTAHALFRKRPLSKRERMLDLMRLCHPPDPKNRALLAETYLRENHDGLPRS